MTVSFIRLGNEEKVETAKPMGKEYENLVSLPRKIDIALCNLDKATKLKDVLGVDFISVF